MRKLIGLIPAAGQAKRISPLPYSKELLPIGFYELSVNGNVISRPKAVSQYVLESMVSAGVERVYIILNRNKFDILRYYGNGSEFGVSIAYLVVDHLGGMPYTLNQAQPWLTDETVLLGMPDTIFTPANAYVRLLTHHNADNDDLTIGLFRTNLPHRFGMVELTPDDRVLYIIDKPPQSDLIWMWGVACWSPQFTQFMNEFLSERPPAEREVVLGDIFQAAIQAGLQVRAVRFDEGTYLDIGTPEDLRLAIERVSGRPKTFQ